MRASFLLILLPLGGCLGPTTAEHVRYHSPISPTEVLASEGEAVDMHLRLRRMTSSSTIRDHVMWRSESGEMGYWELDRWAERPVDVLDRVLSRALYEERGMRRSEMPGSPALDVHLSAFELARNVSGAEARVKIVVQLFDHSGGQTLLERTFEQRVRVAEDVPGPELSRALGSALVSLSGELSEAVVGAAAQVQAMSP